MLKVTCFVQEQRAPHRGEDRDKEGHGERAERPDIYDEAEVDQIRQRRADERQDKHGDDGGAAGRRRQAT